VPWFPRASSSCLALGRPCRSDWGRQLALKRITARPRPRISRIPSTWHNDCLTLQKL
jgi:hypothetical protein